jgi:hypothetical protein
VKLSKQKLAFLLSCSDVVVTAPGVFAYQAAQSTAQRPLAQAAQHAARSTATGCADRTVRRSHDGTPVTFLQHQAIPSRTKSTLVFGLSVGQ